MTDARGPARPDRGAPRAPGTPCWVSLTARSPETAGEFYGALFGWEFRPGPQPLGPYARALLDGHEVAGIGLLPPDRPLPAAWTPYFASHDVDRTAESVRSRGGTVGVGPLDVAGAGRLAIGSDPSGAVFGVWQAAVHLGTAVAGVPGAPAWNELTTSEPEAVAKFYGTVFGFDEEPEVSAGPDRVTLYLGGRPVAGVHGPEDAVPRDREPHWTTYFAVTDADDAVDRVRRLGGRVLAPARDTALGRVAVVADPEGARFGLLRSPR